MLINMYINHSIMQDTASKCGCWIIFTKTSIITDIISVATVLKYAVSCNRTAGYSQLYLKVEQIVLMLATLMTVTGWVTIKGGTAFVCVLARTDPTRNCVKTALILRTDKTCKRFYTQRACYIAWFFKSE